MSQSIEDIMRKARELREPVSTPSTKKFEQRNREVMPNNKVTTYGKNLWWRDHINKNECQISRTTDGGWAAIDHTIQVTAATSNDKQALIDWLNGKRSADYAA